MLGFLFGESDSSTASLAGTNGYGSAVKVATSTLVFASDARTKSNIRNKKEFNPER